MGTGIFFPLCAIPFSILIIILFYKKGHIRNKETKIYDALIISNLLGLVIEILCTFAAKIYYENQILSNIIFKSYLAYLLFWILTLTYYVFYITLKDKKNQKNIFMPLIITYIVLCIILFLLPINVVIKNNFAIRYTTGPAVLYVALISTIDLVAMIIQLFRNKNKLKEKKYIPIITFLFLGTIAMAIQTKYPQILLITYIETLICVIMYFTIENPDLKLLKEVSESKEISDNANEEKTLFLYNITQEIRKSFGNIDESADNIIDCKKIEIAQEEGRNIKGETSKFRTEMNDILDVSSIDSSNIKVYNKAYNIKTILKTVISNYNTICKNKNLEFRSNIEHNLPERLYGDSINLKNVLSKTLAYCVKNTNSGFIELDLNTVIKNDICRLIITLEDSSIGIKSEELENIKINDSLISEAYKTIILMNGAMILTSNYGVGTKIKIVLDQKIDTSEHEENNYTEIFDNKKILVIDDNESSIKIIEKLVKDANVIVDSSMTGRDAINKIKTKNRYDLILLDENLNQVSGKELLQKLQKFRNFNIPVILLSKDNKYEYNLEYEEEGFSDILIKPISKEKLMKIIDKHTKKDNNDIF